MCGIWMRTRFENKIDLQELIHPVSMLSHRGPDGYGWWQDDKVALLHTRLSIIDLAGGAQPLQSFDKKWIGIVNGELYDYQEIRQSLIHRGIQFFTKSDSEVLLNLYAIDGIQGLKNISGEFSFIFYNTEKGEVHFCRDLFGVKPLFYEFRENSFTLASEMKALQNEAPVFDPNYIKTFIARSMTPPDTCLLNVKHVWPGRVYKLDLSSKKLSSDIFQMLPLFQKRHLKGNEAEEMLDHELKQSVRRRLVADVDVGCYLSGGIDSAIIAALAADLGAKPKAFTVGFTDLNFDETNQAASIAQDLGLEHEVVQLNAKNFMRSLNQSIVAFENPITNPHGAAKNLLSHSASQKVKVILTGEGSDEWFGGYSYFRIRKIWDFEQTHPSFGKNALKLFLDREMGMSLNHLDGESVSFNSTLSDFFSGKVPAMLARLAKKRFYRHIVGENLDNQVKLIAGSIANQLRQENPAFQFSDWDLNSWMSIRTDLLHYILSNVGDRQEMFHSIEGRTPFLDTKVANLVGQIQTNTLLRGLTEKYILRKVGRRYLNMEHSQRGKKPFFAPMKYLYMKENRKMIYETIDVIRNSTPWLQWKNIDHFILPNKRSYQSPLEDSRISLVLILYSMGILSLQLRSMIREPRGYQLPKSIPDLNPFERAFSHAI
jgi:asparagine synthase (glutamine-hydrolysing)